MDPEAQPLAPEASPEVPSPTSLTPEPALDAPIAAETPQVAAPEPKPEVTPPEGEDTGAAPEGKEPKPLEPPAWAGLATVDEVLAHETVKPHLERRVAEAETAAEKRGLSAAQSRMQPILNANEARLDKIDQSIGKFVKSWNAALKSETVVFSKELADEIIEDNAEAFQALNGQARDLGRYGGINEMLDALFKGANVANLYPEYQQRIQNIRTGLTDPSIIDNMLDAITEARVSQAKEKWEKDEARLVRDRVTAEVRAEKRAENPPPAKPQGGGAGAGRSDRELKMDPTTPVEKLEEIRARELAG